MAIAKQIFGWFGRKVALYVLLVLAILAAAFVVPWIKTEWTGPAANLNRAQQLEDINAALKQRQSALQNQLQASGQAAKEKSIVQIDAMLVEARQARDQAIARRRSDSQRASSFLRLDATALLNDRMTELDIQFRDREIAGLGAMRDRLVKQDALASLIGAAQGQAAQLRVSRERAQEAAQHCRRAEADLNAFEKRWLVRLTLQLYQKREHQALVRARDTQCGHAKRLDAAQRTAEEAARQLEEKRSAAEQVLRTTHGWVDETLPSVTADIEKRIGAERAAAQGSFRAQATLWAERLNLKKVMVQAAFAFALILATPFLIRLFCYYVLAPTAMRRPGIRLIVPGGVGNGEDVPTGLHAQGAARPVIAPAQRSATSVSIILGAGEELLVRQDYLQSSSHVGDKSTQWFLDWRHPLTSFATGLTFLTRIRGEGQMTSVSAVQDPFAEVTVLTLPEGSACVLQPRALAAFVQQVNRPLRVTSHWRLFSLNAWLTMQLRYLVFHGPVALVIKGGRGVRTERAEAGRIFGQEQLVGFSANLTYSVTRTETFWPYFLGRESLFKDRVENGEGLLIVEEAPMAGRRAGEMKHGIEGMIDAGMKVFGM
ncbi:MAG: hypothetical protein E2598_07295 [Sphingobium sp.]|nr:hypothetical protein [Sphingobium sp.]